SVVRARAGQRQHDTKLEMQSGAERLGVLALEPEHLLDLFAGDAAGAGWRGVLGARRRGSDQQAQGETASQGAKPGPVLANLYAAIASRRDIIHGFSSLLKAQNFDCAACCFSRERAGVAALAEACAG